MKQLFLATLLMAATLCPAGVTAQVLEPGPWQQRNSVTVKMSELFYEANVGVSLWPQRRSADFVYLAFGYGNPTRKNAWRKFIPVNDVPQTLPKSLRDKLSQDDTSHLHAGKIGVGWNHWFCHWIGCYAQAGWAFLADLSANDDLTTEEKALLAQQMEQKTTFIYNTVPVELGVTLNLWKHYNVQTGLTYMWKEIPLLTVGVGYAF